MMRVIVTPAVLPPAALAELKDWLGITTTADDAGLSGLLAMALDVCADFIGLVPLPSTVEETIDLRDMPGPLEWQARAFPADWQRGRAPHRWHGLATRPVIAVAGIDALAPDGSRVAIEAGAYEARIAADGTCHVRVNDPGDYRRAVVRIDAGMAADWAALPVQLRHGIMRLAAHQYRTRETVGAEALPPASVSALWRPWRRMRLA